MIDRLRAWWERPIAEHERRRAFVLAAAVIVLAVAGLSLTRSPATHATHHQPAPTVSTVPAPPPPPPEPSTPPRTDPPAAGVPPDLGPVARRFLEGYLAYLYGRGPARTIPHAAPALLRRLGRERLRISPATRQRHPHLTALTGRRAGQGRVWLTAVIDDAGVARYSISVLFEHRHTRWRATRLSGD